MWQHVLPMHQQGGRAGLPRLVAGAGTGSKLYFLLRERMLHCSNGVSRHPCTHRQLKQANNCYVKQQPQTDSEKKQRTAIT